MRVLGQHEGNLNALLSLGAQMYDTLVVVYPDAMANVLVTYAGSRPEDVASYRKNYLSGPGGGNKQNQKLDKAKREMFRKMTSQVNLSSASLDIPMNPFCGFQFYRCFFTNVEFRSCVD